jgi:hypothetical protein
MKTKLEILQNALASQQRYLRFLEKGWMGVLFGLGLAVSVVVAVSLQVSAPEPLPLIIVAPTVILGGLIVAVGSKGGIWLGRKLAQSQIAAYQRAIEKLEREQ